MDRCIYILDNVDLCKRLYDLKFGHISPQLSNHLTLCRINSSWYTYIIKKKVYVHMFNTHVIL